MSLADVVVEKQEPFTSESIKKSSASALSRLHVLASEAKKELLDQGYREDCISVACYLNCRYQGTDTCIMTCLPADSTGDIVNEDANLGSLYENIFVTNYEREYGFKLLGRNVLVDDIRVRAVGSQRLADKLTAESSANTSKVSEITPLETVSVYFEGGRRQTPVYMHHVLPVSSAIIGPSIIIQDVATVIVEPGCSARITSSGDIEITIDDAEEKRVTTAMDPIYMSIFSHRFMGNTECF